MTTVGGFFTSTSTRFTTGVYSLFQLGDTLLPLATIAMMFYRGYHWCGGRKNKGETMKYDTANGAWLNSMLKKKIYQDRTIPAPEVQEKTGLSIKELVMCWMFQSRNNFKTMLSEWNRTGARMKYRDVQGH